MPEYHISFFNACATILLEFILLFRNYILVQAVSDGCAAWLSYVIRASRYSLLISENELPL